MLGISWNEDLPFFELLFFLYVEHDNQETKPNLPATVTHAESLDWSLGELQDGELVFDFISPCSDDESGLDVVLPR